MKKDVTISIIDDDEIYQFTVLRTLKRLMPEKKVLVFYDGEEALRFFIENMEKKKELPDIIFLDINMPIMDGFEFMEAYAKFKPRLGKKIIVYMVSSSVRDEDINRAKAIEEISDYLIKPIEVGRLAEVIEQVLNEDGSVSKEV